MSQIVQALIWVPLLGAGAIIALSAAGLQTVRRIALLTVIITFVLSVFVVQKYDPHRKTADGKPDLLQMQTDIPWVGSPAGTPAPGEDAVPATFGPDIRFALGVDGISLWLIALTGFLMIPSVLVSWEAVTDRPAAYYALMLVLESGMMGVFSAQDIILFYIFFEFTLIPLFFMIGVWGGDNRRYAARKFFVFTLAGSLLTFLGLLFIVLSHSWMNQSLNDGSGQLTFSIPRLVAEIPTLAASGSQLDYWLTVSPWIFAALFIGFAVKVPLVPFHTWLPLAHVQAPTAGSVLLAGVLLKIGSYGFLRFMLPLLPEAAWQWFMWVGILSVIGIIYGAFLALAQDDIKKLVAYSSVSHMGFCLLGLFAFNSVGITGGMLQMINHGLSTGALFTLVGMLYERYHTRDIDSYSGMMRKYPVMGFFFLVVVFSSIGLPGLNGFTGEILSMMGMFATNKVLGVLSLSGIILGAWYMLQLTRRVFFGPVKEPIHDHGHAAHASAHHHGQSHGGHDHGSHSHGGHDHGGHGHGGHGHGTPEPVMSNLPDLSLRELAAIVPLAVAILWIGLFPQTIIDRMQPSIDQVVNTLHSRRSAAMAAQTQKPERKLIVQNSSNTDR